MAVLGSKRLALVLLAAVAFACLHLGDALKCYDCNSHKDAGCDKSDTAESFLKDCTERIEGKKYTLCRKIVQYIDFEVNGNQPERRVIRSCGYENYTASSRDCYQRSGFGGRQEVCACYKDGCNIATSFPVFSSLSLVACAAALYRLVF